MSIKIRKLSYALGAEVSGVDITKPLADQAFGEIRNAFLEHCVLLFRGQPLNREQFRAFSARFGELSKTQSRAFPECPEVTSVVNMPKADGGPPEPDYNGSDWHSDISYRVSPTIISMLKAVEVPEIGGDTQFANLYLAYETLSDGMKKLIDGLEGVHIQQEKDLDHSSPERLEASRRDMTAAHLLVKVHPETGRKHLYLGDKVMLIVGMTAEESRPLLDFLRSHARRPQLVYVHQWQKHDLVIWDQRCTNHNAVGNYDRRTQTRILEKTTVPGTPTGRSYVDTTQTRNLTHGFNY